MTAPTQYTRSLEILNALLHEIIFIRIRKIVKLSYANTFSHVIHSRHLPLRLLPRQKLFQDGKVLLEAL
jgi:hypothetical protein